MNPPWCSRRVPAVTLMPRPHVSAAGVENAPVYRGITFPLLPSIGVHTGISTPRLPDHYAGVGTLPPRCYLAHTCAAGLQSSPLPRSLPRCLGARGSLLSG